MVAGGRQRSSRSTITPNKSCSTSLYRRIKRRVGCSLERTHCKWNLVPYKEQAAYELSGTKSSFSSLKNFRTSAQTRYSSDSHRQHQSGVIHKQAGRHEVGPTLCPVMENLDLVYQETSNSRSLTHSGQAERGIRQAIQTRPDHPNRVVSPPRGFSNNLQQVAPAPNRRICHDVQQQVASICVTGTGSPGWAFCSEDRASQCEQAAGGVSMQGSEPFFLSRQRAQTEWRSKPAIMWPQPPRRWLGEDIIVYNIWK